MTLHDVIVIGAGPVGSTVANLLAQAGRSVLVLERDRFPRFHVGESLLPADLPVFARLGVDPQKAGFLHKGGAEFWDERVQKRTEYPFADALPGTHDHAYQVERSIFDHWLAERAREVGADVRYGERVLDCAVAKDHVEVVSEAGRHRARYVVDATGLESFFGRRDRTNEPIVDFGLAASFTHVERIDPGLYRELTEDDHGNVKIFFIDDGWCWMIPLPGGKVSAGMVTRRKGITSDWLDEAWSRSPFFTRLSRGAHRPKRPGVLASFSFHNKKQHGSRWSTCGDATCFLDPIFSSGVSVGMLGATHLVDELLPALASGTEDREDLMDAHARHMAHGYNVFATLIHSFYHSRLLHGLFFTNDQDAMLRKGLTSVLAGDVWRDDNPFQRMLMGSKRRRREIMPQAGSTTS